MFKQEKQENHRSVKAIQSDIAKAEKVESGATSALGAISKALITLKGAMALGDEKASTDARAKLVDQQTEELKCESASNALIELRAELGEREQYDELQSRLSDHQRSIDQAKLAVTDWKKKKSEAIEAMKLLNEVSNQIEIYKFGGDPTNEYSVEQHHHGHVNKIRNFQPCADRLINLTNALDREISRLTEISNSTPEELENKNYA